MAVIKVRAPGRINLIGEHTDYNSGFVLPCAINQEITVTGKGRKDKKVILHSINFNRKVEINLDEKLKRRRDWSDYPVGVIDQYQKNGFPLSGMELKISGNIPLGAGLSSSAALEVATALFIKTLNNLKITKEEMGVLCRKAENEFVGVSCGIMDQFASLLSKKDFALFLDCRDLSYSYVPLSFTGYKLVLTDTKKSRRLSVSAYNQRRRECEKAAELLSTKGLSPNSQAYFETAPNLRDISSRQFSELRSKLPPVLQKRVQYVVEENERVLLAVENLKKNDLVSFGKLLYLSHNGLRDLYEVSCPELDLIVDEGRKIKGVIGGRMIGAGFGGCTLHIIREENVGKFRGEISKSFLKEFHQRPDFYPCVTAPGASSIKLG